MKQIRIERCVICNKAFLIRAKPRLGMRKYSYKKYGQKTCSKKCSKVYVKKQRAKYQKELYRRKKENAE